MKTPLISVIMSALNAEKYIERAIKSILNQTFSDFEFIIINDGSTDKTADIVKSFTDKRIVFIDNKENQGIPGALNHGIKIAKGEFIARMDADDESLPERFKMQIDYLKKHTDIGVLGTARIQLGSDNDGVSINPIMHEHCFYRLLEYPCFTHPTVMMRKNAIAGTSYNERYSFAEDYKFWTDLAKKDVIFANLETPLLRYYRHIDTISIVNQEYQDDHANEIRLDYINYIFGVDVARDFADEISWIATKNPTTDITLTKLNDFYDAACQTSDLNRSKLRLFLRRTISDKLRLVSYRLFDKVALILLYYYFGIKIKRLIKPIKNNPIKTPISASAQKTPLVSVVMSAFNAEKHIERAIKSILNQTFSDFEFIIINDGSTDKTADIIKSFNDERIVFIDNKENQGIPGAVNQGLKIAKGEFIARMDADDESLPERFKMQIDYLKKHTDIGVLGTAIIQLGSDNDGVHLSHITHKSCFYVLSKYPCFLNPTVMMRKSMIGNTLYDERYLFAQDYKFWTDLAKKGVIFANLNTPLLKYYRHPTAAGVANIKPQDIYADEIRLDFINYVFGANVARDFADEISWIATKNPITDITLTKLNDFYNASCQTSSLNKSMLRLFLRRIISDKLHLVRYRPFDKVAPILLYYYFGTKIKRLIKPIR